MITRSQSFLSQSCGIALAIGVAMSSTGHARHNVLGSPSVTSSSSVAVLETGAGRAERAGRATLASVSPSAFHQNSVTLASVSPNAFH